MYIRPCQAQNRNLWAASRTVEGLSPRGPAERSFARYVSHTVSLGRSRLSPRPGNVTVCADSSNEVSDCGAALPPRSGELSSLFMWTSEKGSLTTRVGWLNNRAQVLNPPSDDCDGLVEDSTCRSEGVAARSGNPKESAGECSETVTSIIAGHYRFEVREKQPGDFRFLLLHGVPAVYGPIYTQAGSVIDNAAPKLRRGKRCPGECVVF